MATKQKSKPAAGNDSAAAISEAYRDYVLTNDKKPASVFGFCKSIGIKEDQFYKHFGSFESLERAFWKSYFENTKNRMESDSDFHLFSAREKILTFYFAMMESLKADRSFVVHQLSSWKTPVQTPTFFKDFKAGFEEWIKKILGEGKTKGDLAPRPYLDDRYHHLFWLHFSFILQFWKNDDSGNFENTDAAIEKSINLAFDLIGKGVLDNAIDFGKFLYQTSKN